MAYERKIPVPDWDGREPIDDYVSRKEAMYAYNAMVDITHESDPERKAQMEFLYARGVYNFKDLK